MIDLALKGLIPVGEVLLKAVLPKLFADQGLPSWLAQMVSLIFELIAEVLDDDDLVGDAVSIEDLTDLMMALLDAELGADWRQQPEVERRAVVGGLVTLVVWMERLAPRNRKAMKKKARRMRRGLRKAAKGHSRK